MVGWGQLNLRTTQPEAEATAWRADDTCAELSTLENKTLHQHPPFKVFSFPCAGPSLRAPLYNSAHLSFLLSNDASALLSSSRLHQTGLPVSRTIVLLSYL